MKFRRKSARAPEPPEYDNTHVDHVNQDHVSGWALFTGGVDTIEVLVDGRKVGEAEYGLQRDDVEALLPDIPGSRQSGYTYLFSPGDLESERPIAQVQVVLRSKAGKTFTSKEFELPTATLPSRYREPDAGTQAHQRAPFPAPVLRALLALRGEAVYGKGAWSSDKTAEAVDDLIFLSHRGSRETAGLFWYFAYLREMWLRIDFNSRNFPKINRTATEGRKDVYGVATGPEELLVMCHHLATLRSHGVRGNLCEFGCFKGFSTSVLSNACGRLGMTMDVFDSFAGLPDSDSDRYRAGEFAGSREEVGRNVGEFGDLAAVRFHPGFFADSLPHYREPEIACLWMDVDLDVSARDVMSVFPRLAPESCVFSDEMGAENFDGERVIPESPTPDSVLPAICDAFAADGRELAGHFVWGNCGAFYDARRSIPVIGGMQLLRLKDALL